MKSIPLPRVAIIAIAIVLGIGIVGTGTWMLTHHAKTVRKAPTPPPTVHVPNNNSVLPPSLAISSTGPSDAQMQLAIVHKGEGVESALIRQFAADPVQYGFSGKQDDAAAVNQWANHQAHLLAIKAGYYDWKFGAEIRVRAPDKMAYVIQKDDRGNLEVVEYKVNTPTAQTPTTQAQATPGSGASTNPNATATFSQGATHVASTTVAASDFFGASPVTGDKLPVQHFEYVYFPGK